MGGGACRCSLWLEELCRANAVFQVVSLLADRAFSFFDPLCVIMAVSMSSGEAVSR